MRRRKVPRRRRVPALGGDGCGLDRLLRRSLSLRLALRGRSGWDLARAASVPVETRYYAHMEAKLARELGAADVAGKTEEGRRRAKAGSRLLAITIAWRRRRAPTRLGAVMDADRLAHADTESKAHALLRHWSQSFVGADRPGRGASFAQGRAPRLAEGAWVVSLERFEEVVLAMRTSAPGSDGLRYSAWKLSPPACRTAPSSCYVAWMSDADLPPDLAPHETRPLSLAITDSKILPTMLKLVLDPRVHAVLSPVQDGCRPGVSILRSILKANTATHRAACGRAPRGATLFSTSKLRSLRATGSTCGRVLGSPACRSG